MVLATADLSHWIWSFAVPEQLRHFTYIYFSVAVPYRTTDRGVHLGHSQESGKKWGKDWSYNFPQSRSHFLKTCPQLQHFISFKMFLIIFSPKLESRLWALPPAAAEVSFFTAHLLAVRTWAGSDACSQKSFSVLLSGKLKNVWECLPSKWWNFPVKQKKWKEKKTPMVVSSFDCTHSCHTRGSWWVIPYFLFQVCMCPILGSYREQALDQELDFFQVMMRQISLKSYRLQHIWMICCVTATTTSSIWNKCIHFIKQYDLLHKVSLNCNRQTQNVRWWKMLQGFPWCPKRDLKKFVFKVFALPNLRVPHHGLSIYLWLNVETLKLDLLCTCCVARLFWRRGSRLQTRQSARWVEEHTFCSPCLGSYLVCLSLGRPISFAESTARNAQFELGFRYLSRLLFFSGAAQNWPLLLLLWTASFGSHCSQSCVSIWPRLLNLLFGLPLCLSLHTNHFND